MSLPLQNLAAQSSRRLTGSRRPRDDIIETVSALHERSDREDNREPVNPAKRRRVSCDDDDGLVPSVVVSDSAEVEKSNVFADASIRSGPSSSSSTYVSVPADPIRRLLEQEAHFNECLDVPPQCRNPSASNLPTAETRLSCSARRLSNFVTPSAEVEGFDGRTHPPGRFLVKPRSPLCRAVWDVMRKAWGLRQSDNQYNPCPNPVSMSRRDLDAIKPQEYMCAEKTDGTRYSLILMRLPSKCLGDIEDLDVAIMVDRACNKYLVESVAAPSQAFARVTILDGELVSVTSNTDTDAGAGATTLAYVAFDAVCLSGVSLRSTQFSVRQTKLASFMTTMSIDPSLGLALRTKVHRPVARLPDSWQQVVRHLDHGSDGLILTRVFDHMPNNTNPNQFKWKMDHTIDLRLTLQRTADASWLVGLYCVDKEEAKGPEAIVYWDLFANATSSKPVANAGTVLTFVLVETALVRSIKAMCPAQGDSWAGCVECRALLKNDKGVMVLKPVKIRRDKSEPNNLRTLRLTVDNVNEAISYKDILEHVRRNFE
ncbi:mRNA capping enzyme [Mollivirus sibericum]|uniref:mRNA capping enzyme n=1 Tax=Mollivirus sibericum TaxID=1678078 RepID=UPI0006B2E764|nr:mRNA capping enzyme [Mollivirus sibericum]ALD62218.1 mRNA capping enzyme [Mollivirus sibericum]